MKIHLYKHIHIISVCKSSVNKNRTIRSKKAYVGEAILVMAMIAMEPDLGKLFRRR